MAVVYLHRHRRRRRRLRLINYTRAHTNNIYKSRFHTWLWLLVSIMYNVWVPGFVGLICFTPPNAKSLRSIGLV